MFKIKIKSFFSIIISKVTIFLTQKIFKRGTNLPGKIALKLDKNILGTVAKNYKVILVTGTNGKTTTTSMIYNIIKNDRKDVITNESGANMFAGIVTSFVKHFSFKNNKERYAVIEVDEANVKYITSYIKPEIITITNLFRDQLDRYGEVYTTLEKIMEGIEKSSQSKLILNGDESLLGDLKVDNEINYYGFNVAIDKNEKIDVNADAKFCQRCRSPYDYNFVIYNHLGDYYCKNCGYKRPMLTYSVDEIINLSGDSSTVIINGKEYSINQPGKYNIYNGLCALAIAKELNIKEEVIKKSLSSQESSFGRQECIKVDNKELRIILVKNPAGYDEALNTVILNKDSLDVAFLLNDNYADGRDVSWIWDVKFEKLQEVNINNIHISGIRLYDMAVRLKVAGLSVERFKLSKNYEELLNNIKNSNTETVYVLTTYTAMIDFRKYLYDKGYIKKLW